MGCISLFNINLQAMPISQYILLGTLIIPNTPNICILAARADDGEGIGLPLVPIIYQYENSMTLVSRIVCGRIDDHHAGFWVFAAAYQLDIASMWRH